MNTIQLECFVTLSRTLNFMQTAKEMHITQPAVSKQIRALEEELGVKLFFRTTHHVLLTEEGKSFCKDAETVLKILRDAENRFRLAEKTKAGKFGIGYTDPCSATLLSRILAGFLQDTAFVPSLHMGETTENLERLSSYLIDVVLAIRDARFSSKDIDFLRLYDEQFYCVMRKDHPLFQNDRTNISERDFFGYRGIFYVPQYLLEHSFTRGRTLFPVNDDLENIFVHSAEEALLLVRAGAGFALLPYYQTMGADDLAVMQWIESPKVPFGIYYRKADANEEGVERFMRIALEETKKGHCPFD